MLQARGVRRTNNEDDRQASTTIGRLSSSSPRSPAARPLLTLIGFTTLEILAATARPHIGRAADANSPTGATSGSVGGGGCGCGFHGGYLSELEQPPLAHLSARVPIPGAVQQFWSDPTRGANRFVGRRRRCWRRRFERRAYTRWQSLEPQLSPRTMPGIRRAQRRLPAGRSSGSGLSSISAGS